MTILDPAAEVIQPATATLPTVTRQSSACRRPGAAGRRDLDQIAPAPGGSSPPSSRPARGYAWRDTLPTMSHGGVVLVAQVHGQAGRLPELKELLADLAASARQDPGCTAYHVAFMAEPGECLVVGSWDSEAALRAHYRTDAYLRYRSRVGELLTRPSDVVVHHVSTSVHARDPNPPDPTLLG